MLLYTGIYKTKRSFKNIQDALDWSHKTGDNLYEDDEDGFNLIYSNQWDIPTRRAVWRTLRSSNGLSPMIRSAIPLELRDGTRGPDFEVG